MDIISRNNFLQYIRAKIINESLHVNLLGTNNPTYTLINQYIEKERKRLPDITSEKGKGIVNILNGDIQNSNEDTLNFIATLFKIIPKSLREFTNMWLEKKITSKNLIIHSKARSKKNIENQFNEKTEIEENKTLENGSNKIKQTNVLSAFNFSKAKKIKGKISQLNFLSFGNKQEIENDNN